MKKIVQCVPNISEGINLEKIENIVSPLKDQTGFKLISVEPDKDYNRTVITLIGDPEAMMEPLLKFYKNALELIDMNTQKGEHPRMGAVDVLPFIPIDNITIEECVVYAQKLAKAVNESLDIPVFLYAKAAQHKDRENLPTIRKGEFEGMKEKLKDPHWTPDFGKKVHDTFGVTAIGARLPLLAYNIDLNTDNQKVASAIAKAIRQSSGGFQYVQAGPAVLEDKGFVQVTMNILDYKKNPIYRIFETVKMEAMRYQVDVTGSEVVGLIPKEALLLSIKYYKEIFRETYDSNMSIDTIVSESEQYLKIRDFDVKKIIEAHL